MVMVWTEYSIIQLSYKWLDGWMGDEIRLDKIKINIKQEKVYLNPSMDLGHHWFR